MNDNSIMPFGIHKGEKLANVPAKYLVWLYQNKKANGKLKEYIEQNMDVLIEENVPAKYLVWLYQSKKANGKLKEYIERNMDDLIEELEQL